MYPVRTRFCVEGNVIFCETRRLIMSMSVIKAYPGKYLYQFTR